MFRQYLNISTKTFLDYLHQQGRHGEWPYIADTSPLI
jgi:hypothetical protein